MSARDDAERTIGALHGWLDAACEGDATGIAQAIEAAAHAVLALADEQRTANRIEYLRITSGIDPACEGLRAAVGLPPWEAWAQPAEPEPEPPLPEAPEPEPEPPLPEAPEPETPTPDNSSTDHEEQ